MGGNDDLLAMGSGEFKFTGAVEQRPEVGRTGQWRIGGRTVHVGHFY